MAVHSRALLSRFVLGEYSDDRLVDGLREASRLLGLGQEGPALRGLVACMMGLPLEAASKLIDWRAFEGLVASVLAASGFEVAQNLILTKPRMQVDLVAWDGSVALSVDCKHWAATSSPSALAAAGAKQVERSSRLWQRLDLGERPILSAIVTMVDPGLRFASGAAVVPVQTLRDFAMSALAYDAQLEVVTAQRRAPINSSLSDYLG